MEGIGSSWNRRDTNVVGIAGCFNIVMVVQSHIDEQASSFSNENHKHVLLSNGSSKNIILEQA